VKHRQEQRWCVSSVISAWWVSKLTEEELLWKMLNWMKINAIEIEAEKRRMLITMNELYND